MKKGLTVLLRIVEYILVFFVIVIIADSFGEIWAIILGSLYLIGRLLSFYLLRPRCPKCNKIMRLKRVEDKFSFNVSNKVRVSFIKFNGIPKAEKRYYECITCKKYVVREEIR